MEVIAEDKKEILSAILKIKGMLDAKDTASFLLFLKQVAAVDPTGDITEETIQEASADTETLGSLMEVLSEKYKPFTEELINAPEAKWSFDGSKATFEIEVSNPDTIKNGITFKGGTSILRFKAQKSNNTWILIPSVF